MKKNIIIATGGTGGHVFPAMSLAKTFLDNGYNVLITTDKRGEKFFINSNLKYKVINTGMSITNIKSIMNICKGILQSVSIMFKTRPDAVIGFGSYATLPTMIAGKLFGKSIFLHEGNAFIGKINKLFLGSAVNIFTTFQEIYGINIKHSDKISFAGTIVRNDVKQYFSDVYKYPTDGNFNILITGGSGGASFFSNEFIKTFQFISDDLKKKIKVVHQVKTEDELKKVEEFYVGNNIKSEVKTFFDDMPQRMLDSDLIVCRSGIGTIGEISFIGRPCVMIPSPNVANDHQLYNAKFYNKNGACVLVEENAFVAKSFAKEFEELLANKNDMEGLAKNIKSMATIDSNDKIFAVINEYLLDKDI